MVMVRVKDGDLIIFKIGAILSLFLVIMLFRVVDNNKILKEQLVTIPKCQDYGYSDFSYTVIDTSVGVLKIQCKE